MATSPDEERLWAADKRDFVADSRDDSAEERDELADSREAVADARERELDQWQMLLRERADELNVAQGVVAPQATAAARANEAQDRESVSAQRDVAEETRDAATQHRLLVASPTLLALVFAEIAENLYDSETFEGVLSKITEAAVAFVAGGELASVTVLEQGTYHTIGATSGEATAVDQEQYDADEGPCLDALGTALVQVPSFPDERWPVLGARPEDHGVHASLSYRLRDLHGPASEGGDGSLNIYAQSPDAFQGAAEEVGLVLAAHAALAARAVGERATLERLDRHLRQALLSRDVIGQAKGILMERLKTTPDEAFEILKRTSQKLNIKLREVARTVAETGDTGDLDRTKS